MFYGYGEPASPPRSQPPHETQAADTGRRDDGDPEGDN